MAVDKSNLVPVKVVDTDDPNGTVPVEVVGSSVVTSSPLDGDGTEGDPITLAAGFDAPRVATVTLTNAQIKALPTTAIQLIAAPGANKVALPFLVLFYHKWTADYETIDAGAALVIETTDHAQVLGNFDEGSGSAVSNLLAGGESVFGQMAAITDSNYDDNAFINKAYQLKLFNGSSGNLTAGDAANTLQVTIFYTIIDIQ